MYPTEFPIRCVTDLIEFLRGKGDHSPERAVQCVWELIGYGLLVGLGESESEAGGRLHAPDEMVAPPDCDTDEKRAAKLEELAASFDPDAPDAPKRAAFSLPPWAIPLLLGIFQKLLDKWIKN